jgi:hypothetical protein
MKTRKLLLLFMLCFTGFSANADVADWVRGLFDRPSVDYGKWYCSGCQLIKPGDDYNTQSLGQIAEYIRSNNSEIHAEKKELVDRWVNNSRITICDDKNCVDFWFDALPLSRWAPRYPGKARTSSDKPKTPKNPDPQTSLPMPGLAVSVSTTDPSSANIRLGIHRSLPIVFSLKPSVSANWYGGIVEYMGPAGDMPSELNWEIGNLLGWGTDSYGLGGGDECSRHRGALCLDW